jgi:hypothetical protein
MPASLMASAPWRLVAEVEDARAERLRVDELQRRLICAVLKETLPAAQDNGMDHEPGLAEEVVGQQPVRVWVISPRWRLLRPL